jgi:acyl dehydratase
MIDDSVTQVRFDPFTVEVERGRVALFAKAIGETDPVYSNADAARKAGHRDVLVPPTFLIGLGADDTSAIEAVISAGGDVRRLLHGEQVFTYHRPVHAGSRLRFQQAISDVYRKRGGQLEFVVQETAISDDISGESVALMRTVLVFRNPEVKP